MDQASVAGWHDFYVTMGTAGASLVGLLFVALSLNLDVVTDDSRDDLRALAEQAFNSFSAVLLIAIFFLIPEQGTSTISIAYLALGLGAGYRTVRRLPTVWKARKRDRLRESVFWRFVLPTAAFAGLIGVGAGLAMNQPSALYWLVWVIIGLLLSAARSSWDLLVTVGAERRGDVRRE